MARKNAEKKARRRTGGGRGMSERAERFLYCVVAPTLLSASLALGALALACLD